MGTIYVNQWIVEGEESTEVDLTLPGTADLMSYSGWIDYPLGIQLSITTSLWGLADQARMPSFQKEWVKEA